MTNINAHKDWHVDGIEEGRKLWRLDLPDIQIQASLDVTNVDDVLDGSPPEYGNDGLIFIEHDVRGGGATGDDRTKYSCDDWKVKKVDIIKLLALDSKGVRDRLGTKIERVKAMPADPSMTQGE